MIEKGKSLITDKQASEISKQVGLPTCVVQDALKSTSEFIQLQVEKNTEVVFSFRTFGQFKFTPRYQDRITLKRNGRPRNT